MDKETLVSPSWCLAALFSASSLIESNATGEGCWFGRLNVDVLPLRGNLPPDYISCGDWYYRSPSRPTDILIPDSRLVLFWWCWARLGLLWQQRTRTGTGHLTLYAWLLSRIRQLKFIPQTLLSAGVLSWTVQLRNWSCIYKIQTSILLDRFWLRTQPQATSKVLEVTFMQKKLSEVIVCGVTDCRVTLEGKSERKQTLIIRNVHSQQVQSCACQLIA